jgi:hypothetical protein
MIKITNQPKSTLSKIVKDSVQVISIKPIKYKKIGIKTKEMNFK